MKRIFLTTSIAVACLLTVQAQKYKSWHSSVTDRDYGVMAENIKGDNFDCLIYGKSLNQHIPIAGIRIDSKDIPAFVEELRSFAGQAGEWFEKKAPITGIEDYGYHFKTNFKGVTAWYDMGTPPEPQYHTMSNAPVETYSQMLFFSIGAVYLGVAPIVDKEGNRHPGVVLPFGSKQEIEEFVTAVESLNPNEICITCPQCGAELYGKSASLFFDDPHNHEKGCPLFNTVPSVPQVPKL